MSKDKESIQVTIRVRPLSDKYGPPNQDKKSKLIKHACGLKNTPILSAFPAIRIRRKNIHLIQSAIKTPRTICSKKLAKKVHSSVWKVNQSIYLGYNCTIFAYGQTGAGKTYTMMGVNP